jgi:hypothetical protein
MSGDGSDTQRESPKVRGIAGHIEQAERGAIRKPSQAHKHFCPLLELELELELIQTHMTQKPLLWVEVGAHAVRKMS